MKTPEEIEQLAEKLYPISPNPNQKIEGFERVAYKKGYTQCQKDMADKIKEAYEQGLEDGYACMPSTINPLNKQD